MLEIVFCYYSPFSSQHTLCSCLIICMKHNYVTYPVYDKHVIIVIRKYCSNIYSERDQVLTHLYFDLSISHSPPRILYALNLVLQFIPLVPTSFLELSLATFFGIISTFTPYHTHSLN